MTNYEYKHIFQEMSFEMMKDILSFTESPRNAIPKLLEQIREITGAKIVSVHKCNHSFSEDITESHELLGINPARRKNTLDITFFDSLLKLVHSRKDIQVISENENSEFYSILQEKNIGLSIIMPIITDGVLLGSFIILDLPTRINLDLILQGLESLSKIFALTFKGSIFYMDMEEMVEKRTRELQDSENKIRNIIENSTNLFYSHDTNHQITYVSPQCADYLQCTPEEAMQLWTEFATDNPINEIGYNYTIEAINTGKRQPIYELELIGKKGKKVWVEVNEAPVVEDGKTVSIVGSLTDITLRKISNTLLKESEERFKTVLENLPGALFAHDLDGNFILVNGDTTTYTGYTKDELLTMNVSDIDPESITRHDREKIWHDLQKGETKTIQSKHLRKDGSEYLVEVRLNSLMYNDIQMIIAVALDKTEHISAQINLKKSEERFTLAMEASQDGLFDWDLITNEIYYSPGWKKMLGYEYDELPNDFSVWEMLTEPDDVQKSWKMQQECVAGVRDRFEMEFKMKHKDGHWVDILSRAKPIKDKSGKVVRFVGTHVDISVIKKTERELRTSRENHKNILETAQEGFWSLDLHGNIIDVNNAYCKMSGYSREELLTMRISDVDVIENPEIATQHVEKIIKKHHDNFETTQRKKDGALYQIEVSTSYMETETGGQINAFLKDISDRKLSEKLLIESEEKYRNILQMTYDGYWFIDMNGIIIDVNTAYLRMSGYGRKDLIGKPISDFQVTKNHDEVKLHIDNIIKYGFDRFEGVHKRKDGTLMDTDVSTSAVSTIKGNFIIAFIRDITDRKNKEQLIQNQKERLSNIIEGTNAGTWQWNIQTGDVVFNKRWAEIVGYTLEELAPTTIKTWEILAHPDDLPESDNILQKHFAGELDYYHYECRMKHKDGHWIWILDRGRVIEWTKDGKPLWMYGTHQDITDRKKAELEMIESEARFKILHNASFGGIFIHDNGTIIDCNKGLADMSGYTVDELIGTDGYRLVKPEVHGIVEEKIKARSESAYETVAVRKDGSTYPVRVEARNLPYQGKEVRVVEFRDITELKNSEAEKQKLEYQLQQSQKLEAIGTLTGGIAHDFNNLLTPIMGYADMMRYKMSPENPFSEFVNEILNSSLKAKELIQQLLTFSRKREGELAPLNLIPVIKSSVKLIRSSLPVTLNINLDLPSDVGNIMGNNTQIHQIIMNLCINASHAMVRNDGITRGNINIKLKSIYVDEMTKYQFVHLDIGNYVQLTISDDGSGMDKEVLSHIFEPFFTTKAEGKGTGMGLPVVHGIVNTYNGEIKVYSQQEKGTTFHIYFPVTDETYEPQISKHDKFRTDYSEKIFVVDDRKYITNLLKNILSNYGFQIHTSNSSTGALQYLKLNSNQFDLVITDLTMPELTGIELVKNIKKVNPDLPFIILTGHGDSIPKEDMTQVAAIVQKPILVEELMDEITQLLNE